MPSYTSLENKDNFPTWDLLPWHMESPDRHWCFLAEVQQCDGFLRYRTTVKDASGNTMFVAFYPDSYEGFDWKKLKKGHTIAIMYATQHHFLDMTHGVRVQDLGSVHVFPLSLRDLQCLGAEMGDYAAEKEGVQWKCHGCDLVKPSSQMSRCGKCKLFCYCSKDCQIKGWNEKNHKKHCQVARDPSFLELLKLNFSTYDADFIFQKRGRS